VTNDAVATATKWRRLVIYHVVDGFDHLTR